VEENAELIASIGALFLAGLVTDALGKRTPLPRVTLLLLFGMGVGSSGLDLIPVSLASNFELVTSLALMMVGFLLGGKLVGPGVAGATRQLFGISLSAALGTALIVTLR
jgi:NhaP-type Na+/H+ or K+/H+ antiporter